MAITKTKEQIYEWFTTKNWFKLYERNLFTFPCSRVTRSGCTNFKDYLDYAYEQLEKYGNQGNVEYLSIDFNQEATEQGFTYWNRVDKSYWMEWMCKD